MTRLWLVALLSCLLSLASWAGEVTPPPGLIIGTPSPCANTEMIATSASGIWECIANPGAGGGAPTTAQYWVGAADGTLSAEHNLGVLATALVLNTSGTPSAYGGASCTNQVIEDLSGVGGPTCVSISESYLSFDPATQTELDAHITDATAAHASTAISVTPFSTIAATTVQAALEEIFSEAGGGGTPGGSDTQVQYNDGGAFGGDAGLTYNETTNVLTATGGFVGDLTGNVSCTTCISLGEIDTDLATQAELDAHINDTTAAHAASAIAVTPFSTIAATNVQTALEEIVSEATGGTDDQTAAEVPFTPASGIAATDTQAAVEEVASDAEAALAAHAADTTSVHGIADTSVLVTTSTAAGGDATGTLGSLTIAANAVALSTDTTGNYIAQLTAGSNITLDNCTPGEGLNCTINASGSSGNVALDLNNDASDESTSLVRINTTGDTNSIFTESPDNELLIDVGQNWPEADSANGLACTGCVSLAEIDTNLATQAELDAWGLTQASGVNKLITGATDSTPLLVRNSASTGAGFGGWEFGFNTTTNKPYMTGDCEGNPCDLELTPEANKSIILTPTGTGQVSFVMPAADRLVYTEGSNSGVLVPVIRASTTITGLSGATATATNLVAANCLHEGVRIKVTSAVTGATTFDVGDAEVPNLWGDDIAVALNTETNIANFAVNAPYYNRTAKSVILTANGSNFTGGNVQIVSYCRSLPGFP